METDSVQKSDPEAIVFDAASGFSVEEQQEILDRINALTAEKRIALPAGALKTEAKKRGLLFPLLINLGAVVFLLAGFFTLRFFHTQDDQTLREGPVSLGITERRLIQEIRRETSRQITEKEKEINDILSRLADADAEYRELQVSVESLTEAQKERAAALLKMQEDYRSTLTGLQEERTRILEDSRLREAELRKTAEERAKELSSQIEQSQASLDLAMEEIRRLSSEQDRANAAEAQLLGYYGVLNSQVKAGQLDEALATLESMKDFLNAPLFHGKALEKRRSYHLAAVGALEEAVAGAVSLKAAAGSAAPAVSGDNAEQAELQARIAALEQKSQEQERTINSLSAAGTDQGRIIADYELRISGLNEQISSQQQSMNQKDNTIQALMTQAAAQEQQIAERNAAITELRAQAEASAITASEAQAEAAQLRTGNAALAQQNEEQRRQIESIRQLLLNQQ
ncbi:MAG: hypothetical protein LBC62_02630 [Treponema sp.]|jgi:uncharacterized coiled-coil protein SlyX|nr:hypothetical protein [Treponema sp.]